MDYDLYSDRTRRDPYPLYAELRAKAPVHVVDDVVVVSRFDDVQEVLRDHSRFSADVRGLENQDMTSMKPGTQLRILWHIVARLRQNPLKARKARAINQEDPPVHGAMRDVVNRGFTPRRIGLWEKRIRELARESAAQVAEMEAFDFISEVATPLPVTVISELLGVPVEDRAMFKRWSHQIVRASTSRDPEASGLVEAMNAFTSYLLPIVKARRKTPADDLISVIAAASESEAGLTEFEMLMFTLTLLVAGNETTTHLLGNTIAALVQRPDVLARVVAEPTLVPALVEESLRFDSPIQRLQRVATGDFSFHGVQVKGGSQVLALVGSANHDESRFAEPAQFDIDRDARGHLALGAGNHFCLGAALARLEASALLEAFLPRLAAFELVSEGEFPESHAFRGRQHLRLARA